MKTLTPSERRALRALAHVLDPVVIIGHHGLTPGVLKEIDSSLNAHELIKVRCADGDRAAREEALARICAELGAAPVQHLGKLLIVWRPRPDDAVAVETANPNKPSTTTPSRRRTKGAPRAEASKTPVGGGARRTAPKGAPAPGARGKPVATKRPSGTGGTAGTKARRIGVRDAAKGGTGGRSRKAGAGPAPASRRPGAAQALPTGGTRRSSPAAAPVPRTASRTSAKAPVAQKDSRRSAAGSPPPSGEASRRRRRST